MKMLRLMAMFLVAVVITGCVENRRVVSSITSFHQIQPDSFGGKKLAILAFPPEKQSTLEFAAYRSKLAALFSQKGLAVVDDPSDADWLAYVSYGIDGGKTDNSVVSVPQYGQTGGGTTYHSGSVYSGTSYGSYSGTSYTMPTYGITGYSTQTVTATIYTRNLAIDIVERASVDRGAPVRLYEGRATSKGSCGALAGVFGAISEGLLKDWPGATGKAHTVEIPWDGTC